MNNILVVRRIQTDLSASALIDDNGVSIIVARSFLKYNKNEAQFHILTPGKMKCIKRRNKKIYNDYLERYSDLLDELIDDYKKYCLKNNRTWEGKISSL